MQVADRAVSVQLCNAEIDRRVERSRRHEHSRQTNQRVEGGNELRHSRHRNFLSDDRANNTTDSDTTEDQAQRDNIKRTAGRQHSQRCTDSDRHTDHAVIVTLTRRSRAGKSAEGHDEEYPGNEIQKRSNIRVHETLALLLLVHSQHALGYEEAAENVDGCEAGRDRAHAF